MAIRVMITNSTARQMQRRALLFGSDVENYLQRRAGQAVTTVFLKTLIGKR